MVLREVVAEALLFGIKGGRLIGRNVGERGRFGARLVVLVPLYGRAGEGADGGWGGRGDAAAAQSGDQAARVHGGGDGTTDVDTNSELVQCLRNVWVGRWYG